MIDRPSYVVRSRNHLVAEPDVEELTRLRALLPIDPVGATSGLATLAHRNSRMSMLYIADVLANGDLVELDLVGAAYWFSQAAARGLVHGNHGLGKLYWNDGKYTEALEQFRIAASGEFGPSLNYLGFMFEKGQGVPANLGEARAYLERAAKVGHYFGTFNLARMLITGKFGIAQFLRGVVLWVVAPFKRAMIQRRDPYDDAVRP